LGEWGKAMEELRSEAQQAADELFIESRLRFELTVHRVERMTLVDHYTIYFAAGRMGPLEVHWRTERESFKTAVREALERLTSAG
jgi:hypothetical protein